MRRYFSGAATLERRPMRSLRSPTAARTTRARAAYGEAEEFRAWRPPSQIRRLSAPSARSHGRQTPSCAAALSVVNRASAVPGRV